MRRVISVDGMDVVGLSVITAAAITQRHQTRTRTSKMSPKIRPKNAPDDGGVGLPPERDGEDGPRGVHAHDDEPEEEGILHVQVPCVCERESV